MQIIIGNKIYDKVEMDKLEVGLNELSKADMELKVDEAIIFSIVNLMINPASKPYANPYNSKTKTLLVIHLHFVNDQWMIFTLLN